MSSISSTKSASDPESFSLSDLAAGDSAFGGAFFVLIFFAAFFCEKYGRVNDHRTRNRAGKIRVKLTLGLTSGAAICFFLNFSRFLLGFMLGSSSSVLLDFEDLEVPFSGTLTLEALRDFLIFWNVNINYLRNKVRAENPERQVTEQIGCDGIRSSDNYFQHRMYLFFLRCSCSFIINIGSEAFLHEFSERHFSDVLIFSTFPLARLLHL